MADFDLDEVLHTINYDVAYAKDILPVRGNLVITMSELLFSDVTASFKSQYYIEAEKTNLKLFGAELVVAHDSSKSRWYAIGVKHEI